MKVFLVSQEYPPETARGGIGTQTYVKARSLVSRGHEVTVISSTASHTNSEINDENVRVIRIATANLPMDTEEARWLAYSAKVAEILNEIQKDNPPDLIDFAEWGGEGYVYLLNRTQWNYVPVVIQIHGPIVMFAEKIGWPDKKSHLYRLGMEMESTCLRLADGVFSSSHLSTKWCADYYDLDFTKIPRIHTGVDPDIFYPMEICKFSQPTVVFAGRVSEGKGIKYLVEAAIDLAGNLPNLRLCILGRGQKQFIENLQERAIKAGFPSLLQFHGFVTQDEMRTVFSQAHLFAATSLYEAGPGLVNLEAMACGLPVVASNGSGAAEVVIDGENGFLAEPGDPASIRNALEKLLCSEQLRENMSRNAIAFVREEASRHKCINNIERFYQTIIASKGD